MAKFAKDCVFFHAVLFSVSYTHLDVYKRQIQEGMSEIQTVKTAIHEIAHAKLHAVKPDEKAAPEDKKDRHTKEVEAESVAYTLSLIHI